MYIALLSSLFIISATNFPYFLSIKYVFGLSEKDKVFKIMVLFSLYSRENIWLKVKYLNM